MMSTGKQPIRADLLRSAQALCNAFASKSDNETLLSHFSSTHQISAIEHGLPLLAPFLGRSFNGRTGANSVPAYFDLLRKYLTYQDMAFGTWVVDAEAQRVSVKGRAKFTWTEGEGKGQSWDEEFAYILDFDQDAKVTDYQVWADSGAAYLARRGLLKQLIEGKEVRLFLVSTSSPASKHWSFLPGRLYSGMLFMARCGRPLRPTIRAMQRWSSERIERSIDVSPMAP